MTQNRQILTCVMHIGQLMESVMHGREVVDGMTYDSMFRFFVGLLGNDCDKHGSPL